MGANIGTGSVNFITALGAKRVHAFEPAPDSYRLLRQTVVANGLEERITTHQIALSNTVEPVAFELDPHTWDDHRVRVATPQGADAFREGRREIIEVPAATIDSLVADGTLDLTQIEVAWIDIQGHESFLLDGARSLLSTDIPVVIEFWPYGLKRAGGLEQFVSIVQEHYREFLNVNEAQLATDARSARERLEPTSALTALGERYPGRSDHTNLVLFSQPGSCMSI